MFLLFSRIPASSSSSPIAQIAPMFRKLAAISCNSASLLKLFILCSLFRKRSFKFSALINPWKQGKRKKKFRKIRKNETREREREREKKKLKYKHWVVSSIGGENVCYETILRWIPHCVQQHQGEDSGQIVGFANQENLP